MVEIHSEIIKAGLSGRREDPGRAVWKLAFTCHLSVTLAEVNIPRKICEFTAIQLHNLN